MYVAGGTGILRGQHGVILWVTHMRGLGGSMENDFFCFSTQNYSVPLKKIWSPNSPSALR